MTIASLPLYLLLAAGDSQVRTTEVTTLSQLAREAGDAQHQITLTTPLSDHLVLVSSSEKSAWVRLCQTATALGLDRNETVTHAYTFQGKKVESTILEADRAYARDILRETVGCARLLSAMSADEIVAYDRELQSQRTVRPVGTAIQRERELTAKLQFLRFWQHSRATAETIALFPEKSLLALLSLKGPFHEVATLKLSTLPADLASSIRQQLSLDDRQWSVNTRAYYVPTRHVEYMIFLQGPGKDKEIPLGSYVIGPIRHGEGSTFKPGPRPKVKPFEDEWTLEGLVRSVVGPTTIVALVPTQSLTFSERPTPGSISAAPFSVRASYRHRRVSFDQTIGYKSVTPEIMRIDIDDPLRIENWPRWNELYDRARPMFSAQATEDEYRSFCELLTERDLSVLDQIDYVCGGLNETVLARFRYARIFEWVFTLQKAQPDVTSVDLGKVPLSIQNSLYRLYNEAQQSLVWSSFGRTFQPTDVQLFKIKLLSATVDNVKTLGVMLARKDKDNEKGIASVTVLESQR